MRTYLDTMLKYIPFGNFYLNIYLMYMIQLKIRLSDFYYSSTRLLQLKYGFCWDVEVADDHNDPQAKKIFGPK